MPRKHRTVQVPSFLTPAVPGAPREHETTRPEVSPVPDAQEELALEISSPTSPIPSTISAGTDRTWKMEIIDDPTIGEVAAMAGAKVVADIYPDPGVILEPDNEPLTHANMPTESFNLPSGQDVPPPPFVTLGEAAKKVVEKMEDSRARIIRYAARVEVLQAWEFNADLHNAPAFVDRNWLAWDDGPALNVTNAHGDFVGTAKRGDWVVVQRTQIDDLTAEGGFRELPAHVAVIAREEFSRLYRPVYDEPADATPAPPRRGDAHTRAA